MSASSTIWSAAGADLRAAAASSAGSWRCCAPYRAKVILMFVSLLFATAARCASTAGRLAIDRAWSGDMTALTWIVVAFMVSALVYWRAIYAERLVRGWIGQRALQDLRMPFSAACRDLRRLLLAPARRRADLAHVQQHRGATTRWSPTGS